jgi:Gamma-glutamyl cyclotransferase, AIG2-like
MDHPLFVYGTLRDPELLAGVLARPLRADAALAAVAPGFRAVRYPGRVYPALLRAPGAAAPGLVLIDLTPFERDLLDAYEGDEYRPDLIPVMIGEDLHEARAYFPAIAIPPDAPDWTLEVWQEAHKNRVLRAERAAADQLRQKLIAIRPH